MTELLTVGVEEEFLLLDPATGGVAPAVDAVLEHVAPQLREQVQHEYLTGQVEIGSAPVLGLDALGRSLAALRTALAEAAEAAGVRLVAVGAPPLPAAEQPSIVDNERFRRMQEHFGALSPHPGLCGLHVHVGIEDREVGVRVLNQLRPWLPLLHAVTANSPFFAGRDTGYGSWRSMLWAQWPSVGPTPYLESVAHYEELLAGVTATGAMLDDGMLYWYARLSAHLPTVEVRIGDVCPTVADSLLVAALIRALADTVLADVRAGRTAPPVPHHVLVGAHWRAARDGLSGLAVDPADGTARPAWNVLDRFLAWVRPALERHGDAETVAGLVARLRAEGTGADRQRAVAARAGVPAVVPYLAEATRAPAP